MPKITFLNANSEERAYLVSVFVYTAQQNSLLIVSEKFWTGIRGRGGELWWMEGISHGLRLHSEEKFSGLKSVRSWYELGVLMGFFSSRLALWFGVFLELVKFYTIFNWMKLLSLLKCYSSNVPIYYLPDPISMLFIYGWWFCHFTIYWCHSLFCFY